MKRQNVRTLSLIVCTFTYLLIGAAVFDALESENEINLKNELLQQERKMIEQFNISDVDFEKIRLNVLHSKPYKAGVQWKFSGALYFSLLVVSLIGKASLNLVNAFVTCESFIRANSDTRWINSSS